MNTRQKIRIDRTAPTRGDLLSAIDLPIVSGSRKAGTWAAAQSFSAPGIRPLVKPRPRHAWRAELIYLPRRFAGATCMLPTMRLLKRRAGSALGAKASARCEVLTDILGPDLAEQLVRAFVDDLVIGLPKADEMLAGVRDAAIRREHAACDSMAVLALRYDLAERHVLNVARSEARPRWR